MSDNLFYHGTQTAIHELPVPFLDPKYARLNPETNRGYDIDDPEGPHVLLGKNLRAARLYSVKSPYQIANSAGSELEGSHVVYIRKPENLDQLGYVYTVDQKDYAPFQQTEFEGMLTNKWYSREPLYVTRRPTIVVHGIGELMEKDGVICFYALRQDAIFKKIMSENGDMARTKGYPTQLGYLIEKVEAGELGCLNFDLDLKRNPLPAPNRWPV